MKKEQEVIKNNKSIKAKNDSSLETNDNNDVILNDQEEQEELDKELEEQLGENVDSKNNPTKIWALGGIEEIGKNMYCFQQDDEIYIVDCGIKFADEQLPGIDGIICPFDYLVENKEKVKAVLITHGHEDHIGGIPYLLKTLEIPAIYASRLACEMIKKKIKDFDGVKQTKFIFIEDDTKITSKHFKIEFYRVCHSIPDAFGVYIETKNAKIIESGDYKFDFSTNGDESDILKMAELGRRDIDLLMTESTNAETPGFAPSEKIVINELKNLIEQAPGRIFIATFASNLQRIDELIQIAVKANKKICTIGRSMNTNINVSIDIGYLNISKSEIIEPREIGKYNDNEVLILCTGSQGEEMAALNQMANGRNDWISFKPTDTVIFSSNPIPGNFESVERLVNLLYRRGVRVAINSKETKLHTTGHATQQEQQLLFKLINPQYIIPTHGEYKMLRALRQNAIDSGVHPDNVHQIVNGQIVEMLDHKIKITNNFIDATEVYVSGNEINSDTSTLLKHRRALSEDGIFYVTLILDSKQRKLINLPVITSKGSFFIKGSQPLITKIVYSIKERVDTYLKRTQYINYNFLKKLVINVSQFFIWSNKKKHPLIRTTIFDLSKDQQQTTNKKS